MILIKIVFIIQLLNCLNAQVYDSNTPFVNQQVIVDPDVYVFYWNYTSTDIIIKLVVKNTGWIGFGLSPNGGMENTDVVIAFKNADGSFNFTDRTALTMTKPTIDSNQDYKLLFSSQMNGITTVIFTRKLQICNSNPNEIDMDIVSGTNFVIFAWGNLVNNDISYHGSSSRLTKSLPIINMLNQQIKFDMNGVETVEFRVNVIFHI